MGNLTMTCTIGFISSDQEKSALAIFEDNVGTIKVTDSPIRINRTQHIDVRYPDFRETVAKELVCIVKVASERQVADVST